MKKVINLSVMLYILKITEVLMTCLLEMHYTLLGASDLTVKIFDMM